MWPQAFAAPSRILASVLLSAALASPALAQWSSSASTNTNLSTSTSLTGIPSVFPDHAGGAVFAWTDGTGVRVQRLDAFGYKMWGALGLKISQSNQEFIMPRAISDDAGGVIAVWSEFAAGHTGVYAQRVDRTGTALWGAGGIAVNTSALLSGICSDGAGGAIVVWTNTSGSLVQVVANRITAAGTLSWGASGKIIYTSGDLKAIDMVVPSTGNGAILGWHHNLAANFTDPDTLFFQRVDGSGNPQWPSPGAPTWVRVVTLDDTAIPLSCAGSAGAAYYVTQRADSAYLHLLQPAGTFTSPVVGWPICGPATAKFKTGLANHMIPDGAGGVVVAWRDESYTIPTARIRAQRLNASGTRQWPTAGGTFVQLCASSNDQSFPGIVRDGYGNYVFGWEDYRNGVNINLWAQKVEPVAGAIQWAAAGVFFASATDNQFAPRFAAGNPGNVIAAFDDARTGSEKLYAQFLGPAAALTPTSTVPFTTVAPSPVPRGAAGYTTNGSLLFVEGGGGVGGSPIANSLASYDPGTNTWATLGTGYVNRWFGSLAYVPTTGKLYAFGGNDNVSAYLNTVEEIPVTGGAAVLLATNPVPREGAGVAVANGLIYVIGGANDVMLGGVTGLVRAFDPVANTWLSTFASMPGARMGLTATWYNGQIYAVGGQTASGYSKRVDRYDVAANTWTPMADAPLPIAWHSATVTGGLIWFAGDITTGWTLMSYAPATDTWTVHTTHMWSRRFAQAAGIGNTLVVAGGALGSPATNVLETQVSDVSALVAATPLATVTLPVSAAPNAIQAADLVFAAPGESTLVTMNFASVSGSGTATVERYPGPPASVSFSSGAPTTVGTTRWVLGQSGLAPFSATLWIQLHGLPDTLGAGSGVAIYQRATAGSGAFALLPTTYDPATHRVSATVTGTGELILGSGGTVDVPPGMSAALELAIGPLGANPVRGAPSFRFALPTGAPARLDLFDVQGRVVASRALVLPAGVHTIRLAAGSRVASGLYFARLVQGGRAVTTRTIVTD